MAEARKWFSLLLQPSVNQLTVCSQVTERSIPIWLATQKLLARYAY